MQFQALFSSRTPDAVRLDGILYLDADGPGTVASIVGSRDGDRVLDLIIPATLDQWADELALVDVHDTGRSVELRSGSTKVTLRPADARA